GQGQTMPASYPATQSGIFNGGGIQYKFPLSPYGSPATFCPLPQSTPSQARTGGGGTDECDFSRTQSGHPGGQNACLGDGSVKFVSANISQNTWNQVCDPRDGNPL